MVSYIRQLGPLKRAACLLVLLLSAYLLVDAYLVIGGGLSALAKPYPTCKTELQVLDGIKAVAAGKPLYPPVEGLPLTIRIYNPLTYLPAGLLGRVLALDFEQYLVASRVLPFLSMFALLIVLTVHIHKRFANPVFTAFLPLLLLAFHSSTLTDFFRNRPEMPALALSFGGWVVAQHRPKRWPYVAGVLFAAAIAFKQTFISAPVAVGLLLLMTKEYGPFLRLFSTTTALGLGVIALSHLLMGGGYFTHAFGAMASNPFEILDRSRYFYGLLTTKHWGLLLPAALVAVGWLAWKRQAPGLLVYLATCLLWTSVAHGKFGSDINYHGELSILMVLAVVVATATMLKRKSPLVFVPLLLLASFSIFKTISHGPGWNRVCLNRAFPEPHCRADIPPFADVAKYSRTLAEDSERTLVLQDELAVRLGNVQMLDWYMMGLFFNSGFLDFGIVQRAIESRVYRKIVFPRRPVNRWMGAAMFDAEKAGYAIKYHDEQIVVMETSERHRR